MRENRTYGSGWQGGGDVALTLTSIGLTVGATDPILANQIARRPRPIPDFS